MSDAPPDRGRATLRGILVLLLFVLVLIEVQGLALLALAQARAPERWVAGARGQLLKARPQIARRLAHGHRAALLTAGRLVDRAGPFVLLDASGRCLASRPVGACAPDPTPRRVPARPETTAGGRPFVVGPTPGPSPQVRVYLPLLTGRQRVYLRLDVEAAALAEEFAERRQLLALHGFALVLIVTIGVLAAVTGRRRDEPGSGAAALGAYEAAMDHLRVQGSQRARSHEAEVQRLQETLRDREAMARAGELTSGIVHEVRNGLGTLSGYVRLLERGAGGTAAEVTEIAGAMREECTTLEGVVRRIADFVRSEVLRPEGVDLRRMVERVVTRENRRPGPGARVADGPSPEIQADEDLLERAFENLVRNAREAAGEKGHVTVALAGDDAEWVAVTISDDGPGLSPVLEDGFRPFLTTKPGGLGLGLSMALKLVALHGGRLFLANDSPHGVRATVLLPTRGLPGDTSGSSPPPASGGAVGGPEIERRFLSAV